MCLICSSFTHIHTYTRIHHDTLEHMPDIHDVERYVPEWINGGGHPATAHTRHIALQCASKHTVDDTLAHAGRYTHSTPIKRHMSGHASDWSSHTRERPASHAVCVQPIKQCNKELVCVVLLIACHVARPLHTYIHTYIHTYSQVRYIQPCKHWR
jgi:hypothetical protein